MFQERWKDKIVKMLIARNAPLFPKNNARVYLGFIVEQYLMKGARMFHKKNAKMLLLISAEIPLCKSSAEIARLYRKRSALQFPTSSALIYQRKFVTLFRRKIAKLNLNIFATVYPRSRTRRKCKKKKMEERRVYRISCDGIRALINISFTYIYAQYTLHYVSISCSSSLYHYHQW